MGKSKSRGKSRDKLQAPINKQPKVPRSLILLVALVGMAAVAFFLFRGQGTVARSPAPPAAQESVMASKAKAGFANLRGRWQRPDGGYVIDIKEIEANGKMSAAYFNPRPINVSQAEAAQDGNTLKVFIELRDINYPGATYHLTYDPGSDQLKGVYFQPTLQQRFEIFFVRMK